MLQASTRKQGGAVITANNSVRQSLSTIDIPGLEMRQDQDVIRIEMPADELFQAGTVQLSSTAYTYLDRVADAIARNYPRQRIAIEGHTDSAPTFVGTTTTTHQLSCMQALAVFDILTRRNHLPARQLFVMGMGANHPRASNATDAGRARTAASRWSSIRRRMRLVRRPALSPRRSYRHPVNYNRRVSRSGRNHATFTGRPGLRPAVEQPSTESCGCT